MAFQFVQVGVKNSHSFLWHEANSQNLGRRTRRLLYERTNMIISYWFREKLSYHHHLESFPPALCTLPLIQITFRRLWSWRILISANGSPSTSMQSA